MNIYVTDDRWYIVASLLAATLCQENLDKKGRIN
jgi:hypothetical protein